jgi:hypothetical protein
MAEEDDQRRPVADEGFEKGAGGIGEGGHCDLVRW